MERLTSNKPVSEMGMYELAHNSCYIKDGKVRVRDFENDSDAREFIRKIFENIADDTFIDDTDEIFDEVITDYLQYGTSNLVGLIAVFYRNLCATADLREQLKKYEDLEEQGKLLILTCAVGDKMTENEAIKEFNKMVGNKMCTQKGISQKQHELFQIAMDTLEEIQQYRAIGTVEECREGQERQQAQRPHIWGDGCDNEGNEIYDMYDCQNCDKSYEIDYHDYKYCPECGQTIDRSDIPK